MTLPMSVPAYLLQSVGGAARPDAMEVDETKRAAPSGHEIDLEEKRRLDHLENMDKIEKEFSEVKERLFQEKMTSLDDEMKKVEAGACFQTAEGLALSRLRNP